MPLSGESLEARLVRNVFSWLFSSWLYGFAFDEFGGNLQVDGSCQSVGGGHVQQLRRPVADQPGVDPAGGEGRVESPGEREVVETGDGEVAPDCEPGFADSEVEAVCHIVVTPVSC